MVQAPKRPRVLFLGTTYAGWKTRQQNIEAHTRHDPRIRPTFHHVTGWREGGLIERVPVIPAAVRGRARAAFEARKFATFPRPDVIWTSCSEVVVPYLWSQLGPMRRPLVVETDWTLAQQEAFAPIYFGRPPRRGIRRRLGEMEERALCSVVSLFTPISNWAADGLRAAGVEDRRIRVLYPGVDLEMWQAPERPPRPEGKPLRLLFVGGDFDRKGGPMLLRVVRERLAGRVELDIVTRDEVEAFPGVRVHRAEPNSALLRALYRDADLFAMPTRAECFGHATVEAMASGLPAIVGDVGGARDIVEPGRTGWLIRPDEESLAAALEEALALRAGLPTMGQAARQVAERKFDGRRNDDVLVEILLQQASLRPGTRARRHHGVAV
ncbi:MAG: glycosyltransferase family 4 protein [Chloroflexi bacterium]|nr:glycosyltransferase family 4 protein [Chloroflexota bacterium]